MHECEPFTADLWICTKCGGVFDRVPRCNTCSIDPGLVNHECQPPSAIVEGECEKDPILEGEGVADKSSSDSV